MDKTLIDQLQAGNPRQRRAATYKMGKSKDPCYVPFLIKAYDDTDASVRQNVMDALRLMGTNESNMFLSADAAERARIKNDLLGSQTITKSDDNEMAVFIKNLQLDRGGLNLLLERINNSALEEQVLLKDELRKLFGDRALEWWQAIARDREIINGKNMTKLAIPAPAPGNFGSRMAVAGAIGLLTGNINAGVLTASSGGNLSLNEKIQAPSICNLCGVEAGTHFKVITKDVVFSELGAALGGPLMGQKKVELQVPVCGKCANLAISPGVSLDHYLKVEGEWFLVMFVANPAVAEQWMKMNQGRLLPNTDAPVSDPATPSPVSPQPEKASRPDPPPVPAVAASPVEPGSKPAPATAAPQSPPQGAREKATKRATLAFVAGIVIAVTGLFTILFLLIMQSTDPPAYTDSEGIMVYLGCCTLPFLLVGGVLTLLGGVARRRALKAQAGGPVSQP